MLSFLPSTGEVAMLAFGVILGLKHATEVDHVVAVSTIVSEHRSVWRSAFVGALWGAGHTVTLIIVGIAVVVFKIAIPTFVTTWAELGVATMIMGLGVLAIARAFQTRHDVNSHQHRSKGQSHPHLFDENGMKTSEHLNSRRHIILGLGLKPVLVGAMHGIGGSAALTVLILTQFKSIWISIWYLVVFGFGSVCGMLLMSGLIGVPFALVGHHFTRIHLKFQAVTGTLSVIFGLWYAFHVSAN